MNEQKKLFLSLMIGAIGIVYGDIGTSPLYAIKNCFTAHRLALTEINILGVSSLIFWSLVIVVSFKYVFLILKLDNQEEGGILTLTYLCSKIKNRFSTYIPTLGIIGTSLFFGDAIITPAISVLGALEGLSIISKKSESYIIPISLVIITLLFLNQKKGSAKIGVVFGAIMLLWFSVIGYLGLIQIIQVPSILLSINPYYAFKFLLLNKYVGILTLGTTVLVITGAEALYADIGHFGKVPIKVAWYFIVFPLLVLNYLGQAALLMDNPKAIVNPFYLLAPDWFLYPLIILATFASIIASQAVISGCFSLCWQAMQLYYLPRMKVVNTSYYNKGQVYLPTVNYLLLGCVILVILLFQNVSNLSSMYGMAITHIMFITTVLAIFYFAYGEKWHWIKCVIFLVPLFIIDLIFVGTSYAKFLEGAWFPLIIALIICCIIIVWVKGKRILYIKKLTLQGDFINIINNDIEKYGHRIPGIAIFMNSSSDKVPNSLIMHLKHNKLIHEQVIFLSIIINDIPKVRKEDMLNISSWGVGFYNIIVNYGFSEVPNIDKILQSIEEKIKISLQEASFYLSKGIPVASKTSYLKIWQKIIFIFLFKNASSAVDFYNLPSNRVVELGFRFEI